MISLVCYKYIVKSREYLNKEEIVSARRQKQVSIIDNSSSPNFKFNKYLLKTPVTLRVRTAGTSIDMCFDNLSFVSIEIRKHYTMGQNVF